MGLLPTVEKSWQRVFNINSGTTRKQILLDKFRALTGVSFSGQQITSNAMIPVKTSNATAVVTGSNWNSTSDINSGASSGAARSWALLQNVLGRQLLIDYRNSVDACTLSMSPSGLYTGGTTTAAPTASDEIAWGQIGLYDPLGSGDVRQNVWHSADGKQTVIATLQASTSSTLWMFGDLEDSPADWARPCILWADATSNDQTGGTFWNHLRGASGGVHVAAEATPGVNANLHMIGPALDTSIIGGGTGGTNNVKNGLNNEWDIFKRARFTSLLEVPWGPLGYWPDLYFTIRPQAGALSGDHMPSDTEIAAGATARQWVKFNDLLLPWFGAAAMVVPT